jgi:hypothetical protein
MVSCCARADPSGRSVQGVGLRPLACWDCGFELRWGHGCLSVVSVVSSWSLRRADPTSRGALPNVVCLDVIEEGNKGGLGPLVLSSQEKIKNCVQVFVEHKTKSYT